MRTSDLEVQIRGQLGFRFGSHRLVQNAAVFVRIEVVLCRVVLGWASTPLCFAIARDLTLSILP